MLGNGILHPQQNFVAGAAFVVAGIVVEAYHLDLAGFEQSEGLVQPKSVDRLSSRNASSLASLLRRFDSRTLVIGSGLVLVSAYSCLR